VRRFPGGQNRNQELHFYPAPFRAPLPAFAVLVFPWVEDRVLLCEISGRGWCVPSGRVEPNESSQQAGCREAMEEAGAELSDIDYIGSYEILENLDTRWADCFSASVSALGERTMSEESRGIRLVTLKELPNIYYLWNPLTQMVFEHSYEAVQRKRTNMPKIS
jgi:8-oxo-dGTP diphosphatase